MTRLHDEIAAVAAGGLERQGDDGAMPAGHNGPYHDPETPARNTSHWTCIFLDAFSHTGEDRFERAAERTVSYLLSSKLRPSGATFHHRDIEGKDSCNGLIGQAWTIEALSAAASDLDHEAARRVAEETFLLHPFDEETGLWKRVEVDGRTLPYDRTFNHQLWFAASGALVPDAPAVERRVRRFLNELDLLLDVSDDGLIRHLLHPAWNQRRYLRYLFQPSRVPLVRNHLLRRLRPPGHRSRLREKAIGYHSFNLYALSLLKRAFPDHPVWNRDRIRQPLKYSRRPEYVEALATNDYAYPYNPPGFELPFAWEAFDIGTGDDRGSLVRRQFERCYDESTNRMCRNTADPATHTARVYEATRLSNYDLED